MISAQELRIGNWVHRVTNNERHVQFEQVKQIPMDKLQSSYVKPIELTYEILIKAGFEKMKIDRENWCELKIDNIKFISGKNSVIVGVQGVSQYEWISSEFKYLHDLQNIFNLLTGKELNIEL